MDLLYRTRPRALSADSAARWICQVTSFVTPSECLFAPDDGAGAGGGGGAGGERTFTQADLDRIVGERLAKQADKLKALEAQTTRLTEIEQKLAEADAREQKAREEAELKGKSEVEKLQIQIQKATDAAKAKEAEWLEKLQGAERLRTDAEQKFVGHVKRSAIADALLAAGVVKTASADAALSFLSSAQIELDDDHQVKSVIVGGKSFDKPAEAAKHFLTEKPYFAESPPGGSGTPRTPGSPPRGTTDLSKMTAEEAFNTGLSQPRAPVPGVTGLL